MRSNAAGWRALRKGATLEMKAAVFHGPNQPLTIEQVDIDDPQDHEVLASHRRNRRVP